MQLRSFLIVSASRCGSTALERAFNLIPGIWVANQPRFDDVVLNARAQSDDLCESAVAERVEGILSDHSGIKHVFDPSGHPFQEPWDAPGIAEMERDAPLWRRLNTVLLNYPGLRVVFLCRRNNFHRFVSDHVGHSTGHWGYESAAVNAAESGAYKKAVATIPLPPIDETLCRWYIASIPLIFEDLRRTVTNPVLDVWYEDLFGSGVGLADRIDRFRQIVEFLDLATPPGFYESADLRLLLRPSAKLNDRKVFTRIPNYAKLLREYRDGVETDPDDAAATASSTQNVANPEEEPAELAGTGAREIGPRDWWLRSAAGCVAGFASLPDDEAPVRIEIIRSTGKRFDVQLNILNRRVERGRGYTLFFRAKSGELRHMGVGISRAGQQWHGLGLYLTVDLSADWQDFEQKFTAPMDAADGRLHFDLGECVGSVEISQIRLRQHCAREEKLLGDLESARAERKIEEEERQRAEAERSLLEQELSALHTLLEDVRLRTAPTAVADAGPDELLSFTGTPAEDCRWTLRVAKRSAATLLAAEEQAGAVRVEIARAVSQVESDIQLNHELSWEANRRYSIHLRMRSDRPRTIGIGLAKNCAPWTNAGFYTHVWLSPRWQTIRAEFQPAAVQENGRLHLDLGGWRGSVELSEWSFEPAGGPEAREQQLRGVLSTR